MLKTGRKVTLRTFNGKDWTFTRLGREFYKTARKEYIVQLPVIHAYYHAKGRVTYGKDELLPSTATALGTITLPYVFDNPEQELRRRVADWIRTLEKDHEGRYVVEEDYYRETFLDMDNLDRMRFDEEGVRTVDGEPAVQATLNRPVRGEPLVYCGTEHALPEAFRDTGECLYRLLAQVRVNGVPAFGGDEELSEALDQAFAAVQKTPQTVHTRRDGARRGSRASWPSTSARPMTFRCRWCGSGSRSWSTHRAPRPRRFAMSSPGTTLMRLERR
jgi:hypothetical protein